MSFVGTAEPDREMRDLAACAIDFDMIVAGVDRHLEFCRIALGRSWRRNLPPNFW